MTTTSRLVIDTSTLISGAITDGITATVFDTICIQQHTLLFSADTYNELYQVLHRPKFDRYITLAERETFLDNILEFAELVPVISRFTICRDPKDNKFLALALDGQADYLISSDRDLRVLDTFHGIPIRTPREFYDSVLSP